MSNFVLLGPILLQGFEIPQQITWGGRQKLAIHTLPGGDRVIDSLGRDDIDISWSGVFSGPTASSRARTVDRMRADGATWPLTWSTFFYSVVIKSFAVDYTRANWLPYQISCTVLRDETARFTAAEPPLTAQVLGDVSAANGLAIGVDLSAALGLIANLHQAGRQAPRRNAEMKLADDDRPPGHAIDLFQRLRIDRGRVDVEAIDIEGG